MWRYYILNLVASFLEGEGVDFFFFVISGPKDNLYKSLKLISPKSGIPSIFLKIANKFFKNRLTFLNFDVQKSLICQNDPQNESYSIK